MEDGTIKQFLKLYREWVNDGAHETPISRNEYGFSTCTGLCYNLALYSNRLYADVADYHLFVDAALAELNRLFERDGLPVQYPFGRDEYLEQHDARTFHLDPIRMAWVDRQLETT